MTKPTAAAMRAMRRMYGPESELAVVDARLVDQETGLPELIAACEAATDPNTTQEASYRLCIKALRIAREGRS